MRKGFVIADVVEELERLDRALHDCLRDGPNLSASPDRIEVSACTSVEGLAGPHIITSRSEEMGKLLHAIGVKAVEGDLGLVGLNVPFDGADQLIQRCILGKPVDSIRSWRAELKALNEVEAFFNGSGRPFSQSRLGS